MKINVSKYITLALGLAFSSTVALSSGADARENSSQSDLSSWVGHSVLNPEVSGFEELLSLYQAFLQRPATTEEQLALNALLGETNELEGDQVFELVDSAFLAWFWNQEEEYFSGGSDLFMPSARVSRTEDYNRCASVRLCVVVSKATQRMFAVLDGAPINGVFGEPISTARPGKFTPVGTFGIGEIAGKNRWSGRYKGAYLGYAMQLDGHIFIHATSADNYSKLGSPASAGCIRSTSRVAEQLNSAMKQVGREQILVIVTGDQVDQIGLLSRINL